MIPIKFVSTVKCIKIDKSVNEKYSLNAIENIVRSQGLLYSWFFYTHYEVVLGISARVLCRYDLPRTGVCQKF